MKKIILLMLCSSYLLFAQVDYELEFNSSSLDYAEVQNASSLIANISSFSMSCWLNPQTSTNHSGIIGFRNNLDADFYLLQLQNTNNIEARFRNSNGLAYDIVANNIIDFNQWQHLALTYDGSYLRLYKNGLIVDSVIANGTIVQPAETFKFGALDWQGSGFHLNGKIDEVRLWNTSLSSSEISNWMCLQINQAHTSYNNLIGYWRLNDGAGTVINDISLNGNNGNLINNTYWSPSTSCFGVTIQLRTYVADDNFEDYLELNGMGDGILLNDSVFTDAIDTVLQLDVSNLAIVDFSGIEDFSLLSKLNCRNNNLSSVDMSSNSMLVKLDISYNQLTQLDVSGNTALKNFNCAGNQLQSIDVSNNTVLNNFQCQANQFTSLDLSNNLLLDSLACLANNLINLDLTNNTALLLLNCAANDLIKLDISKNSNLKGIECSDNQNLISLDLRNGNNQQLDLNSIQNPQLKCIDVDDVSWSNTNWTVASGDIDQHHYFSSDCSASWSCFDGVCLDPEDGTGNFNDSIVCASFCVQNDISYSPLSKRELIKVLDIFGRQVNISRNKLLFYIYNDGFVERKILE